MYPKVRVNKPECNAPPQVCPTTHFWAMATGEGAETLHKLMLEMDASQDWQARWTLSQQKDLRAEDLNKGH